MSRLPPWFRRTVVTFESLFTDSRNVTSFTRFVSAVIMVEVQWTVSELSRGISRPDEDAKSGSAYRYFLGGADWSATDIAQYHADYAFECWQQHQEESETNL